MGSRRPAKAHERYVLKEGEHDDRMGNSQVPDLRMRLPVRESAMRLQAEDLHDV